MGQKMKNCRYYPYEFIFRAFMCLHVRGMEWADLESLFQPKPFCDFGFFNSLWEVTHSRDCPWDCCAEGFFLKTSRHIGLGVASWKSIVFSLVTFGWILGFFSMNIGEGKDQILGAQPYTLLWWALFGKESSISWLKKYQIYSSQGYWGNVRTP